MDALAIDWFGRSAGAEPRPDGFEYVSHFRQTTWPGIQADLRAGTEALRSTSGGLPRTTFSIGFCFGGRLSFLTTTLGLGMEGAIGFYGSPTGSHLNGSPAPADLAGQMRGSILGIFGGDDAGIPAESVDAYEVALSAAGVDHRLVTYPGAPHSFFDRKAEDFADASAAAWDEVLRFIGERTAPPA